MSFLSGLWAAKAKQVSEDEGVQLRDAPRLYFRVTDEKLARSLRRWYDRRRAAEKEITDYLKTATLVLGGEVPHYKIDEKGRVESINFRYAIGFTHEGWKGIPHTNWLVPDSDEVKKAVAALPVMPGFSEVNKLLDWPELEFNPAASHVHIKGYKAFTRAGNRQIHISASQGAMYVSVPYPETYADVPEFCEQVRAWQPPQGLEQIDPAQGARIERFNSFTKSPLGQVIGGALQRGLRLMS